MFKLVTKSELQERKGEEIDCFVEIFTKSERKEKRRENIIHKLVILCAEFEVSEGGGKGDGPVESVAEGEVREGGREGADGIVERSSES